GPDILSTSLRLCPRALWGAPVCRTAGFFNPSMSALGQERTSPLSPSNVPLASQSGHARSLLDTSASCHGQTARPPISKMGSVTSWQVRFRFQAFSSAFPQGYPHHLFGRGGWLWVPRSPR